MFSVNDIKNDNTFRDFIKDKDLKKSSKNIYAYRLKGFSDFIAKSPSEIMGSYESKQFEKNIFNYIQQLRNDGKSEITIQNYLDTLKTFYNRQYIKIPSNNDLNKERRFETQTLNKSHVKKVLNLISKRDGAIILLQFTSGISPQQLRDLTYYDFIKAMDDYIDFEETNYLNVKKVVNHLSSKQELIGKWLITKKTGEIFYTFNTTESSHAILNYIMYRELTNIPIRNLLDPLFVNKKNLKLKKSTYDGIFTRINKKTDFKHLETNKRFFAPINLKKAFKKALLESSADKTMLNVISGIKSIENWDKENIENFKISYKRNSKFLIMAENDEVEYLKTKLKRTDVEINELKNQIKYLRHLMTGKTK